MRLNPNPPNWATSMLRSAYFHAGRYEDALNLQQRRPRAIYSGSDYVLHASIFAGLGRQAEAYAAVKEALAARPRLSIESWLDDPAFSEVERSRLFETMRKAGFPVCASAEYLKESPNLKRLPECTQAQTVN
jgi:tetratricopeptide (TPR) repeat protein